ncbi:MAG: hypothetical protein KC731_09415 [Myxococcales bacterium]|nr:hypothetical protein [Myxococcales bacterium]
MSVATLAAMSSVPELLRRFQARCLPSPATEGRGSVFEQRGEIRLKPDSSWMPFWAEQWMAADRVAFCWHARVKMAPLVTGVVEDAFDGEHGRLDAKIWGVFPIAHGRGLEVDRGEAQRYLAEIPWNPAAISDNPDLHFGEGSDGPIRVFYRDAETYVDLRFDDEGDIVGVFSRSRTRDGERLPWEGVFGGYADMGGVRVPTHAEVSWHLPTGPFCYWRAALTRFAWRS